MDALANGRGSTPWAVVHDDLTTNATEFAHLERRLAEDLGVPLTRVRLHDLLLWLVTSRRWAGAVTAGRH